MNADGLICSTCYYRQARKEEVDRLRDQIAALKKRLQELDALLD